jgi:hypothetical protein
LRRPAMTSEYGTDDCFIALRKRGQAYKMGRIIDFVNGANGRQRMRDRDGVPED